MEGWGFANRRSLRRCELVLSSRAQGRASHSDLAVATDEGPRSWDCHLRPSCPVAKTLSTSLPNVHLLDTQCTLSTIQMPCPGRQGSAHFSAIMNPTTLYSKSTRRFSHSSDEPSSLLPQGLFICRPLHQEPSPHTSHQILLILHSPPHMSCPFQQDRWDPALLFSPISPCSFPS